MGERCKRLAEWHVVVGGEERKKELNSGFPPPTIQPSKQPYPFNYGIPIGYPSISKSIASELTSVPVAVTIFPTNPLIPPLSFLGTNPAGAIASRAGAGNPKKTGRGTGPEVCTFRGLGAPSP